MLGWVGLCCVVWCAVVWCAVVCVGTLFFYSKVVQTIGNNRAEQITVNLQSSNVFRMIRLVGVVMPLGGVCARWWAHGGRIGLFFGFSPHFWVSLGFSQLRYSIYPKSARVKRRKTSSKFIVSELCWVCHWYYFQRKAKTE